MEEIAELKAFESFVPVDAANAKGKLILKTMWVDTASKSRRVSKEFKPTSRLTSFLGRQYSDDALARGLLGGAPGALDGEARREASLPPLPGG